MNSFFDLHLHPSFKPYLSDTNPDKRKNCWDFLNNLIGIVKSQSCLDQMKEGRVNLAVAGIYTMERPLTSSYLIEQLAPKLTVLDKGMLHFPTFTNYFQALWEEVKHLERSENHNVENGQTFQIIKSIDEFQEGQMNIILAIEGAHGLEGFNSDLLSNFRKIKQNRDYRFLYLTLVHMTQYPIATHAYGMKLIKKNNQFKPKGLGLTKLGEDIIDMAYDESLGKRVYIDIKHLSLVSRVKFYRYRKAKGYDNIPILATHMGMTGMSWDRFAITGQFSEPPKRKGAFIEVNYERPRGIGKGMLDKTFFNPWSLNLYNEDIKEILASDGLIGISLDQRILGSENVKGEFFSLDELSYILSDYKDPENDLKISFPEGEFTDEKEVAKDMNERKHLRHLCNNILYVVKIGGESAWEHMCIGSDFDGLIDPINFCKNSSEFPKLQNGLLAMLPLMMEEDDSYDYDSSNLEKKVRGIMFENAFNFLQKYFR